MGLHLIQRYLRCVKKREMGEGGGKKAEYNNKWVRKNRGDKCLIVISFQ